MNKLVELVIPLPAHCHDVAATWSTFMLFISFQLSLVGSSIQQLLKDPCREFLRIAGTSNTVTESFGLSRLVSIRVRQNVTGLNVKEMS